MGSLLSCCAVVPTSEVGVVEKWGKYQRMAPAGLEFTCHPGSKVRTFMTLRVRQMRVSCESKTKDNVFVVIDMSVQYRVVEDKMREAFYELTDPAGQITSYLFDTVRSAVPKLELDQVFAQKDEVARACKLETAKAMEKYGYDILDTLITDVNPDARVKASMNEINAAARLRVAALDRAEADKIRVIKQAEGDAESKYLSGVGISKQRAAIVEGLRESVVAFNQNVEGTSARDVIDLVLIVQYFDTLKDIGAASHASTVFVPHGPGAVAQAGADVRQGFLEAAAGAASRPAAHSVPAPQGRQPR